MAGGDIHDPTVNNRVIPGQPILFSILSAVACLLVILRIYTRHWVKRAIGWDDYTIVVAITFALGWFASMLGQIYIAGNGRHSNTFTHRQQSLEYRWNIVSNDLGGTSRFFSRLSICLFLWRIVQRTYSWRAYLYTSTALNACLWVATVIVYSAACAPGGKGQKEQARCIKNGTQDIIVRVILTLNAVVDLMISLLPFLIIRRSQLNIRSKLTFCLLVGFCALTAACSIARVIAVDYNSPDANWDLVPLTYWSASEEFGLIIVACLPAAHQLVQHYREHHTFSRIRGPLHLTGLRTSTLDSRSTSRHTHRESTMSTEKLNQAPAVVIMKTTEVDLELQDNYGQGSGQLNGS